MPRTAKEWEYGPVTGTWIPIYEDIPSDSTKVGSSSSPPKPGAGDSDLLKKAEKELKEQEFIIQGGIDIAYPNPHLVGGKPILLANLGKNFSGLYQVEVIKHTINASSGYTQTGDVKRNAIGANETTPKTPAESNAARPPKQDVTPSVTPKYHVVSKGETLWGIAVKYYKDGSKYPDIAKANNISNPNLILVGQKLLIP